MPFKERWTSEVYYDILRSIHRLAKEGGNLSLSSIAREALVPNNRLKNRIAELRVLGLVDEGMRVTRSGYSFCHDYVNHVDWFLRKYGLHPKS